MTRRPFDAIAFDCYGTLARIASPMHVHRTVSRLAGRMTPSPMTVDRPLVDLVREAAPATMREEIDWLAYDLAVEVASVEALPGVVEVIADLRRAGITVAIASNLARDYAPPVRRLFDVDHLALSFEIGAAKPDVRFFASLLGTLEVPPSRILMVGDSMGSDHGGATAAGMTALLVSATPVDGVETIPSVEDLPHWLERCGAS